LVVEGFLASEIFIIELVLGVGLLGADLSIDIEVLVLACEAESPLGVVRVEFLSELLNLARYFLLSLVLWGVVGDTFKMGILLVAEGLYDLGGVGGELGHSEREVLVEGLIEQLSHTGLLLEPGLGRLFLLAHLKLLLLE